MHKIKFILLGAFAMGLITVTSCNNSEKSENETEVLPDPAQ